MFEGAKHRGSSKLSALYSTTWQLCIGASFHVFVRMVLVHAYNVYVCTYIEYINETWCAHVLYCTVHKLFATL